MKTHFLFFNRDHLASPIHSTSSQSSSISRPRTKAALKGYEGVEMSLPATRIDLRHSLNRSPTSNGCKLAALADIALGTDFPCDLIESSEPTGHDAKRSPKVPCLSVSPAKSPVKHSPSLLMSSDSIKAHSMELKSKSFEAFTGTPKSRKRARQSVGKRTGYKEKKKKPRTEKSTERPTAAASSSSKPKDIYDFEESHDSVEDEIIPLTHTRCNKVEALSNADVKPEAGIVKTPNEEPEDESSYSDRDDYYNFNSVSGSGTEDHDIRIENSDQDTKSSSFSQDDKSTNSKPQKKNLIMGRIFKKKDVQPVVETKEHHKTVKKPILETELDQIFDNLKNRDDDAEKRPAVEHRVKTPRSDRKAKTIDVPKANESECEPKKKTSESPRKSRNEKSSPKAEQSARGKESPNYGKRKTQRRCATNRQNKFVETWSSDEYEEFHTTKDIIALIQEAEMKEQRSKEKSAKQQTEADAIVNNPVQTTSVADESSTCGGTSKKEKKEKKDKSRKSASNDDGTVAENKPKSSETNKMVDDQPKAKVKKAASVKFESEDESDFDEHWNKSAKRAKSRKRRLTIASRTEELPEEKREKTKATEKPAKSRSSTKKSEPAETSEVAETSAEPSKKPSKSPEKQRSGSKAAGKSKDPARRKRNASDTLYYWSSSSDDEFGRIEPSENDDDASENQLEQHGWIVGDSHKKLVTLLAHAKGKKIEDCGVKESVHKRK